MPLPSLATLKRRKLAMKERKLQDLVSGRGSLRIVVRALCSKSQQQLADRMHFIENLGKSNLKAAFKGIGVSRQQEARKRKKKQKILKEIKRSREERVDGDDYGIKTFQSVQIEDLENNPSLVLAAANSCMPGRNGHIFKSSRKEIHFQRAFHVQEFCSKVKGSTQQDPMGKVTQKQEAKTLHIRRPYTVPSPERASMTEFGNSNSSKRPVTSECVRTSNVCSSSNVSPFNGWEGLFAHSLDPPFPRRIGSVLRASEQGSRISRPSSRGTISSVCTSAVATYGENLIDHSSQVSNFKARPQTGDSNTSFLQKERPESRSDTDEAEQGLFSRPSTATRPGTASYMKLRPHTTKTESHHANWGVSYSNQPRHSHSASELKRPGKVSNPVKRRKQCSPLMQLRPGTANHIKWSRDCHLKKTVNSSKILGTKLKNQLVRKRERARHRQWNALDSKRKRFDAQDEYNAVLKDVQNLTENKISGRLR